MYLIRLIVDSIYLCNLKIVDYGRNIVENNFSQLKFSVEEMFAIISLKKNSSE